MQPDQLIRSAFDIPLPLTGTPGGECRTGGAVTLLAGKFETGANVDFGLEMVNAASPVVSGPRPYSVEQNFSVDFRF